MCEATDLIIGVPAYVLMLSMAVFGVSELLRVTVRRWKR